MSTPQQDPRKTPSSSNFSARDSRVKLQVGERQFITTRNTLETESPYFRALLSGRWDDQLEDGTYFIDSDPMSFEAILRYLRTGTFPLFFDAVTQTHDYTKKYLKILGDARYFGIDKLQ
ncbi:BTB/POZ protein [Xylariaceae sp. FL0662B]|nr:BTB/POZ protein [Xylariaceae sp. FL0662B]